MCSLCNIVCKKKRSLLLSEVWCKEQSDFMLNHPPCFIFLSNGCRFFNSLLLPHLDVNVFVNSWNPPLIHWLILPFPEAWEVFEMSYAPLTTAYVFCYSYSMLFVFLPDRGPAQAVWTGLDVADGGGALELEGESAGCCGEWPQPLRCALRLCCQWWQHTEHHERYDCRKEMSGCATCRA